MDILGPQVTPKGDPANSDATTPSVDGTSNESGMTSQQIRSFDDLIAEFFVRANQNLTTSEYQHQQQPPVLGVSGITLPSGLDVLHMLQSGTQ